MRARALSLRERVGEARVREVLNKRFGLPSLTLALRAFPLPGGEGFTVPQIVGQD